MENEKRTIAGQVKLADEVVEAIAAYAALEVDGVSQVGVGGTAKAKNPAKGVKVVVTDKDVAVEMMVRLKYGYNVPETSAQIQSRVQQAIENMTGLGVSKVDIRIAGIAMPGEKA